MPNETSLQTNDAGNIATTETTRPGQVQVPAVDIYENGDTITLLADMPGVEADDLQIDLNEGVLTITGVVKPQAASSEMSVLREYREGTYQRRFTLSQTIDQEGIDAKLHAGVLRLRLPKVAKAKPRKISVKSN